MCSFTIVHTDEGTKMPEIDKGEFSSVDAARAEIDKNHPRIASYDTPWWGDKDTESGNLSNRGYVIGFKDLGKSAQWRLDYDEKKKLHINWTQELPKSATDKECYRISSIRPESTLWDYYVGWTKSRLDEIPKDVKDRLDQGGTKKWNGRAWVA